jgi:hypothetical protein
LTGTVVGVGVGVFEEEGEDSWWQHANDCSRGKTEKDEEREFGQERKARQIRLVGGADSCSMGQLTKGRRTRRKMRRCWSGLSDVAP